MTVDEDLLVSINRVCATMRISTSVDFFPKGTSSSDSFDTRDSKPAIDVYDDYMKNEDIFVWTISEEGRLNLTLEAPGLSTIPLRLKKIVMKIGGRNSYDMKFVQAKNDEDQGTDSILIHVALSAVDPCLNVPSPFWGSVEKKYVCLAFLITVEFAAEPKQTETFIKEIYFHVRRGSGAWTRFFSQVLRPSSIQIAVDDQRCWFLFLVWTLD